jgi:alkylation response protein AidB-like acyl-CoA dehydrogenase
MALTAQQVKQAEELLFSGPQALGVGKALYFGHFQADAVFPFPQLTPEEAQRTSDVVAALRRFFDEKVDSFRIDRDANIPRDVIAGLGKLGVLGMTAPIEYGGRGFRQLEYVRIMEEIGAHDASIAVFVNANHSIGSRALLLEGTEEQKRRWLPGLSSGEYLAAFGLTEPEAGSDAANVQTTATPTADGKAYVLNGEKRYITNGGIAQVLTVMARTPSQSPPYQGGERGVAGETKITAFLVTPDMPGFEVVEARMPKCGIRGTATAKLAFHNMRVPAENVLGKLGKGLKLALTVLDFGRTTFGASCTGAAKACVRAATQHANTRKQFGQTLGEFELVRKKLANMAAYTFAMESMTHHCAHLIDSGCEDFMLETAMLKVFSTEGLWQIVNDTIQIHGGKAYFTDEPYERWLRDARINQIGEGANDVLRSFIALVGMRGVGENLKRVKETIYSPWTWLRHGRNRLAARFWSPDVPVKQSVLLGHEAAELGRRVRQFGNAIYQVLFQYREGVFEKQLIQERIAEAAMDLYASACVISRLDSLPPATTPELERDLLVGRYFLRAASRRIRQQLAALWDHDDDQTVATASIVLSDAKRTAHNGRA